MKDFKETEEVWESHDEWQFADRDAERKFFFEAGRALGKKEGMMEAAEIANSRDDCHAGCSDYILKAAEAL